MRSPGKKVKVKRCRRESEGGERERLRRLSGMETAAGCVLSERHPVAAGLFNTSVFVIIPHKQRGEHSKFDNLTIFLQELEMCLRRLVRQ